MAPTCSARQDGGEREEGGPPSADTGAEGWGPGVMRSHRTSSSGQPPAPEEDTGTPEAPALWARPRCTASCSARWARTGSPLIPWFGAHRVPRHGPSLVQSEPQTRPAVYPSVSRSTATRPSACPDPTVSGSPPCGNNQGPRPQNENRQMCFPRTRRSEGAGSGGRDGFVLGGGDGSVAGGGCGLRTAELALGAGSRRGRRGTCLAPSGWPWVGGTEEPFPARVCHAGSRNQWTAGATFVGARARPSSPEADAVLLLCSVAIPEVTPKSLPAGWGACSSLLLEMRDTGGRGGHGEAAGQCALPPR